MNWKAYPENKPEDDQPVLIKNVNTDSGWARAYYDKELDSFFPIDCHFMFPLVVTHFLEIPELEKNSDREFGIDVNFAG